MRRAARPATRLLFVLALVACGGDAGNGEAGGEPPDEAAAGIDRATFIEVVVALREATEPPATDSSFQERKREILAEHDVTEAELQAFIDAHADVDYLHELWTGIRDRLEAPPDAPPELIQQTS